MNLVFVNEYSLQLSEIHLVNFNRKHRIPVCHYRDIKDISTIPGPSIIIFNDYIFATHVESTIASPNILGCLRR